MKYNTYLIEKQRIERVFGENEIDQKEYDQSMSQLKLQSDREYKQEYRRILENSIYDNLVYIR